MDPVRHTLEESPLRGTYTSSGSKRMDLSFSLPIEGDKYLLNASNPSHYDLASMDDAQDSAKLLPED